MKKVILPIGLLLLGLIMFFGLFLVYVSITDFTPDDMEQLRIKRRDNPTTIAKTDFTIMTWNIGYAGLGHEMDFFYDGGKKVRATKEQSAAYLGSVKAFLADEHATNFILLQEVDIKAKRSYRVNQRQILTDVLYHDDVVSAVNYQIPFVPVPLFRPMGQVKAGMMTFARFEPTVAIRHAYPSIAGWPERLFLLDRCFIETRFAMQNGKELVLINTHNSAFVDDQSLMQQELDVIAGMMTAEYEKGNYVVAGGDWNMNPPDFEPLNDYRGNRYVPAEVSIPASMLAPDWQYAFDASVPSNRHLDEPYTKGETGTTTLDFFILSPNIELISVEARDLGFEFSDHNPVIMRIAPRL
ncbi:MAG: hypothetical protein KGZ82_07340 [Bacteroidales bacterium]|nr:hypothetical protein [Bacteroidales bacterium]